MTSPILNLNSLSIIFELFMLAFSLTTKSRKMNASCSVSSTGILVKIRCYLVSHTQKRVQWYRRLLTLNGKTHLPTTTTTIHLWRKGASTCSHQFWIDHRLITLGLPGGWGVYGFKRTVYGSPAPEWHWEVSYIKKFVLTPSWPVLAHVTLKAFAFENIKSAYISYFNSNYVEIAAWQLSQSGQPGDDGSATVLFRWWIS